MPARCSLSLRHSFFRSLKSPPLSSTKKSNSTNYCTGLFHTPPIKSIRERKRKKNQLSIYEPFAWHFQTVCRTVTFVMFALHYVLETTQKWLQEQRWILYKHYIVLEKGLGHMWILVSVGSGNQWPKLAEGWLYVSVCPHSHEGHWSHWPRLYPKGSNFSLITCDRHCFQIRSIVWY